MKRVRIEMSYNHRMMFCQLMAKLGYSTMVEKEVVREFPLDEKYYATVDLPDDMIVDLVTIDATKTIVQV